jgi:hypothetical protein
VVSLAVRATLFFPTVRFAKDAFTFLARLAFFSCTDCFSSAELFAEPFTTRAVFVGVFFGVAFTAFFATFEAVFDVLVVFVAFGVLAVAVDALLPAFFLTTGLLLLATAFFATVFFAGVFFVAVVRVAVLAFDVLTFFLVDGDFIAPVFFALVFLVAAFLTVVFLAAGFFFTVPFEADPARLLDELLTVFFAVLPTLLLRATFTCFAPLFF